MIETERLLLRLAKVSDAEAVYNNWVSDPQVSKFMRWNTHTSIDETKEWLAATEARGFTDNVHDWLFVLKETGEPIGSGGVFYNSTCDALELGYCVMRPLWGKGIASEAAKAILQFATEKLGKTKIYACHAKENMASGKILEKLGFVYTGDTSYAKFDNSQKFESSEYFYNVPESSESKELSCTNKTS